MRSRAFYPVCRTCPPLLAALFAVAVAGGCASLSPKVDVIGVSPQTPGESLMLFVEVTNPTQRDLELSRLQYRLQAASWFETSGDVRLSRDIDAGAAAVIEVPVRAPRNAGAKKIPYTLTGRLYAREDQIERSWHVSAEGALAGPRSQGAPFRIRVADTAF